MTASLAASTAALSVRAPARLHLGFLDPSGSLGRPFGSLGLVIDGFETVVEIASAPTDRWQADGPAAQAELDRAAGFVARLRDQTGRAAPLALRLRQVLPAHSGFGSGTQLALAVGRAFARWQGLSVPTPALAHWLGRGLRSGIGIAGFDAGGLLVDGGPGASGQPAPVLARGTLPAAWRVIVIEDTQVRGLSGAAERAAIAALPPLPRARAADLCHQVLMRILPGAAQGDFAAFATGLDTLQAVLGDHFAPAQGGSAWVSADVARLVAWWRASALAPLAAGQSSWGPTGFAIVASAEHAERLTDAARRAGQAAPTLRLSTVRARDHGATVTATER